MEAFKFTGMTLEEFSEKFEDDLSCKAFLLQHKWGDGFVCSKCGYTQYYPLKSDPYARACKFCEHINSVTAGTIFHKLKFGIRKAFQMMFVIVNSNKTHSANQMARMFNINKNTVCLFEQKIKKAMDNNSNIFDIRQDSKLVSFSI